MAPDEPNPGDQPASAYEGRTQPSTEDLPGDLPEGHKTRGVATGKSAGNDQPPGASDATKEERRREGGGAPSQRDYR